MQTQPSPLSRARRLAIFCVLIPLAAAAQTGNVDPKKGRVTANPTAGNRYSIEQEVQLGRQAAAEMERKLKLLPPDHPMSKYIAKLGGELAAKAPGYQFPYTFKVVQEKSINAFALPGGPIYVHTGLIDAASEAELAGVMGHEISHVVMRHSTRQASRQMKAQIPLAILGGILGAGVGGLAGSLGQMGISFTAGTVFMKYSRDAETEADMVGAQIMYDAGFDPTAVVSFFQKLKAQGDRGGPQFLSSHPDPGNRANDITKILSRFPRKTYRSSDSPEYVAAKRGLANAGTQTGSAANVPEMPRLKTSTIVSQDFATFQQVGFSISYPSKWKVNGNADSTLTIYPDGGAANGAVSYGAIVSGYKPKKTKAELDDAVRELIADTEATSPDLQIANSPRAVQVHTYAARQVEWFGKSPVRENGQPMKERVRMVALEGKGGLILYMIFVAPTSDFDALAPVFDRMQNSFRVR